MTQIQIGTNKVLIWKNDLSYLDIGYIENKKYNQNGEECERKISQSLFTGIQSVDDFNKNILNSIKYYENQILGPKLAHLFDVIKVEDITAFIISQLKWRRCSAYLVIQTSHLGYRYLCYFYDHIHHSAECFGTSYQLVKKNDIIKSFNQRLDEIKKVIDLDRYPELKDPIFNRDFEKYFGIS